jgi:HTH-type transcriptional regulator/antitoxin HigA
MSQIRVITSEAHYDDALREVERYFDHEPEPGSAEEARAAELMALIEGYEAIHWQIDASDCDLLRPR